MPPGGIVGEVSATESWSARQWGWSNILAELPRIHLPRTRVDKGKEKGRSPDMEPRPSARAAYGEPTLLLDLELPVLALVALYVRVLVKRVAPHVLCPARHRGLVGPPRAEVARWIEGRLLGGGVVTDGGRNPGGGAVRVEPDQLEGCAVD